MIAKPPEPLATMLPLVLRASGKAFCAAQAHSLRPAEAGGGFMRTSARTLCWTRTVIFLTAFGSNISLMGLLEPGHRTETRSSDSWSSVAVCPRSGCPHYRSG